MRKWHFFAGIVLALGAAGGYRYFTAKTPVAITTPDVPMRALVKHEGHTEESDVIEPILVGGRSPDLAMPPAIDDGPMPRVMLEPGMKQPPRPDGEGVRQMPYADE